MGCNNEADTKTLGSARSKGDAESAVPNPSEAASIVTKAARAVADAVNRAGDIAILKSRSGAAKPVASDRSAYGDVAEAAVAQAIVERFEQHVVHINTKPNEKGLDLVTYDHKTESIFVWEVKSTLQEGSISKSPPMSQSSRDGKQMGHAWLNNRLASAGLDKADARDVETRAVKVDLHSGRAQIWSVDPSSGAKETVGEPFDIEDLLDLRV